MQFTVYTDEFSYGLGMVTKALPVRAYNQATNCVLLETPDTGLRLTCTDGEITIKASIDAQIAEDGCALLPAKLLADLIRKQSAGDVSVNIDRDCKASIRIHGSAINMIGMTAEDFPEISDVQPGNVIQLPCGRLREAISKIMFAVSSDESRKVLTGVLMETYRTETRFVCLDGYRLAMQCIERENPVPEGQELIKAVVPGRVMSEVSKLLPDNNDMDATITYNASHIMFEFGKVKLYASLLTGEYIDYKRILPDKWTTEVNVDRQLFSRAIERCGVIASEGKNKLIYLSIENGRMFMRSNAEIASVDEEIEIACVGESLRIAFAAGYMMDVIKNLSDDTFTLCFNSSVSPCVIKPAQGSSYLYLVLPVRTFQE